MTNETTPDVHYRLIDNDGRWSLYRDDASGATQPVILDTTERIARVVLAELNPETADEVIVPAVTVPAGTIERMAEVASEAQAFTARLADLYRAVRPAYVVVDQAGDGVFGDFEAATRWNELWRELLTLTGACMAVAGSDSLGDVCWPDWIDPDHRQGIDVRDVMSLLGVSEADAMALAVGSVRGSRCSSTAGSSGRSDVMIPA